MKAVLCTHFGGPETLQLADIPEPVAAPGQAIVAVKAAGLNFFDTLQIAGKYQVKPPFPFSPGAEFAGVVESVAPDVAGFKPGDRVVVWVGHGAAAERVAAPATAMVKIPAALEFERAAALTVTYGTSLYALKNRAEIKPGETLAVLGASGGVGLAAVELGHLMGARVIACASSEEKLAFARQHGADATINYAQENLRDALRAHTEGRGVDVVYDPVGGAYTEAAVRALDWGGRLLVVGFAAGEIPKLPLNLALLKSIDIRGVFWGAWSRREPAAHQANMAELVAWAAAKKLSAHVHATYPLAETAAALTAIANRQVMGKVVLRP
jgi:NADPH2:quinone reductase